MTSRLKHPRKQVGNQGALNHPGPRIRPEKSKTTIMYTKSQSSTTSIVAGIVAAIGLFLATMVFGQSQDAGKTDGLRNREKNTTQQGEIASEIQNMAPEQGRRGRRGRWGRRLKTIDELPDSARTLTLENGKELYFHEGQFYTFAESRSKYVQIPQALFTAQGLQRITNDRRMKQAKMRHARQHHRHYRRFHRGRRWTQEVASAG